ncbi:hypothetical protein [Nesterenkonia alba]|uniref:hypothetical protein n=1 Tax=Nesterenkonia alba TaxID=515814 RepID=UPI0003B42621|nr:hypothetical protein [Nesterenkonia alba]
MSTAVRPQEPLSAVDRYRELVILPHGKEQRHNAALEDALRGRDSSLNLPSTEKLYSLERIYLRKLTDLYWFNELTPATPVDSQLIVNTWNLESYEDSMDIYLSTVIERLVVLLTEYRTAVVDINTGTEFRPEDSGLIEALSTDLPLDWKLDLIASMRPEKQTAAQQQTNRIQN